MEQKNLEELKEIAKKLRKEKYTCLMLIETCNSDLKFIEFLKNSFPKSDKIDYDFLLDFKRKLYKKEKHEITRQYTTAKKYLKKIEKEIDLITNKT